VTVETLRPNAAGTYTELQYQYPAAGAHWDKVDEDTADDDNTYVRCIDYMDVMKVASSSNRFFRPYMVEA